MATEHNFALDAGATETLEFRMSEQDGSPMNLAGCDRLDFTLRDKAGSPDVILEKRLDSGVTITDEADGVVQVVLSRADTVSLSGRYDYDVGGHVGSDPDIGDFLAARGKVAFKQAVGRNT